jgi:hypothetical protein
MRSGSGEIARRCVKAGQFARSMGRAYIPGGAARGSVALSAFEAVLRETHREALLRKARNTANSYASLEPRRGAWQRTPRVSRSNTTKHQL